MEDLLKMMKIFSLKAHGRYIEWTKKSILYWYFRGTKKEKKGGITTVIAGYNVIKKIH